jgi:hypothetical protein
VARKASIWRRLTRVAIYKVSASAGQKILLAIICEFL